MMDNDEILQYLDSNLDPDLYDLFNSTDYLAHEGRSKKDGAPGPGSGRWPLGSGEHPYQRYKDFRASILDLKAKGMSEKEIANAKGMTMRELRQRITIAKNQIKIAETSAIVEMHKRGMSNTAIAEKIGVSEGTVRNALKPGQEAKLATLNSVSNALRDTVDQYKYVDIGKGVERWMGITPEKLSAAVTQLKDEGYTIHNIKVPQVNTGNTTTTSVLAPPGVTRTEVSQNRHLIRPAGIYTEDQGKTYRKIEKPRSVDSSRVMIRYAEDGGKFKDGEIELRRGVEDISLHNARYAQVRIAVDDTHYIKGMAVYGKTSDFPEGVDIIFNTNKKKGTPMLGTSKDNTVLKPLEKDKETGKISEDNPFKASIKQDDELIKAQRHYIDANGNEQLSCLNIVNEEGNWGKWSKNLASQFLSKQDPALVKRQLALAYKDKNDEFSDISRLTNPEIKKKLLLEFSDECDSSAVYLKAAAMPRQQTHVLLPFPNMKKEECYAPNYNNGEKLALVRYPHAGIFEIPVVTVNNNYTPAKQLIKNSIDAIGINHKVAEQLSGADFDGDTVIAIPLRGQKIRTSNPLPGLKDFDPKAEFPKYEGMKVMSKKQKSKEMGVVTNLICDMQLKGASTDELERAVRHSMVVIDAEKHELDWKRSEKYHKINELKKKYQYDPETDTYGGASTLISRAKSTKYVPSFRNAYTQAGKIKEGIDIHTGERVYEPNGKTHWDKKKNAYVPNVTKVHSMAATSDASTLLSPNGGTYIERIYRDHANALKALANKARLEYLATPNIETNAAAKKKYAAEISSLNSKLDIAERNSPLERQALILANYNIRLRFQNNPDLDNDDKKKIKNQEMNLARQRVGAKKELIKITDKEWEAIQSGAITSTKLKSILNNTDVDALKERATPRVYSALPPAKISRAKAMLAAGYTQSDVAEALGVSVSTLIRNVEKGA